MAYLCLVYLRQIAAAITGNITISHFFLALTPVLDVDQLPSPDSCECVHEPKAEKAFSQKFLSDPALETTPERIF